MEQYTIYFADKSLTISSEEPENERPDKVFVRRFSFGEAITRAKILQFFEISNNLWLILPDPDRAFTDLGREFVAVEAAGGVVRREDGELLMIYRNGRWDLPKGRCEAGERVEESALREVEEETGVGGLRLVRPLCQTLHAYNLYGRWELKRTHWFEMATASMAPLQPQQEEGITRAEWLTPAELQALLPGCFPTIRKVLATI